MEKKKDFMYSAASPQLLLFRVQAKKSLLLWLITEEPGPASHLRQ